MMTYFRMQPPSHGTGPLAPGHPAMPLPGATSLSATPARRRLAVKVQPPRASLGTGQIPAAGRLATRLPASPLSGTDLAQARSNILPNIVLEIRSTDFADCLVRLQAEATGDDFLWISVVPPKMDRALLVGMGSGVGMKPFALIFSSRPVGDP
jgi:hypothetical protein